MNSIIYLLQVSACTGVFYLFYYLFLNRLTFFVTNRWYLLVTVILSFVIPLIKIQVDQPHLYTGVVQHVVYTYASQAQITPVLIQPKPLQPVVSPLQWGTIVEFAYLMAVLGLTVHLIFTLAAFFKRVKGKQIAKLGNVHILSGDKKITNGSFLNYIFLNDGELSADEMQQIIAHEMLHVKLYHSVDRIIVKIAQIILWFNPFIYLYARSVEENHEFEVDRAMARGTDKHNYANLLVHLSVAGQGILYHNFSKVPLKKRIAMLFNQPSANMKKIVYVLIVPVVLISCLAFAGLKSMDKAKTTKSGAYHFYDRVHLKRADGSNYDLGVMHLPSMMTATTELLPKDKVGFLIGKKMYDEASINTISSTLASSLNGDYSINQATKEDFPGIDVSSYQKIVVLPLTSAEDRKRWGPNAAARAAYEKTEDYKRKIKLAKEMQGKTFQIIVNNVSRDKINNIINRISFEYQGDKYKMDFLFGYRIEPGIDLKNGDQISVKVQLVSFDAVKPDSLDLTPSTIYKGKQKLFPAPIVSGNVQSETNKTIGDKLVPPRSSSGQIISKKTIEVSISKNLEYTIEQKKVDVTDLEKTLSGYKSLTNELTIVLSVDKTVPIKDVAQVMDTAKKLNIKMVLATVPIDTTKPSQKSNLKNAAIQNSLEKEGVKTNSDPVVNHRSESPGEMMLEQKIFSDPTAPFFSRLHFQHADGTKFDAVVFKIGNSGGSAILDVGEKVGAFIDGKFYNEDAIKKLSHQKTATLIIDSKADHSKLEKIPNNEDYAIPFIFKTQIAAAPADTIRNGQKIGANKSITSASATDSSYFDSTHRINHLYGNANVVINGISITADYIRIDEVTNSVFAKGNIDPKTKRYSKDNVSVTTPDGKKFLSDSLTYHKGVGILLWKTGGFMRINAN